MFSIVKSLLIAVATSVALNANAAEVTTGSSAERQSALDGTQYEVLTPIYTGSAGNISYVRLFASTQATTTFTITVVGSPSGHIYGTTQVQVPGLASPQYAVTTLLTMANATGFVSGDTSYALYFQTTSGTGAYLHVLYNSVTGFFENLTACKNYLLPGNFAYLINVDTSAIPNYPAQIFIQSAAATTATSQVAVIDANNGSIIGTFNMNIGANTVLVLPESFFEQSVGWTPSPSQYNVNLQFSNGSNDLLVGQSVVNQQLSAYLNITAACSVP